MTDVSSKLRDVGLLVAVPVERDSFYQRLSAKSDFVGKYAGNPAKGWSQDYEPNVARPVNQLIDYASAYGAEVVPNATLSDLTGLCQRRSVVLLIAHWKGPEIKAEDLPADPDSLWPNLDGSDSPVAAWFRQERMSSRSSIQSTLSNALDQPFPPSHVGADIYSESVITRRTRIRDDLSDLFAGLLVPGNRLEFFDGLHSRQAIAQAIPEGFHGFLDLVSCNSMVLADYLSGRHRRRFRIAHAPHEVWFHEIGAVVEHALRGFAENGLPYAKARLLATQQLEWAAQKG